MDTNENGKSEVVETSYGLELLVQLEDNDLVDAGLQNALDGLAKRVHEGMAEVQDIFNSVAARRGLQTLQPCDADSFLQRMRCPQDARKVRPVLLF